MSGCWKRSALPLARRWGPLAALLACVMCDGSTTVGYDASRDEAAMATIAGTWSTSDGSTVSLCEDVVRSNLWKPGESCVREHVIRGGGRGVDHVARHPDGNCGGGCLYGAFAYVVATVVLAPSTDAVTLSGDLELNASGTGDPYAKPYHLNLTCTRPDLTCFLDARILDDGRLQGEFVVGHPASPDAVKTPLSMTRTGPATCDPAAAASTDPAPAG